MTDSGAHPLTLDSLQHPSLTCQDGPDSGSTGPADGTLMLAMGDDSAGFHVRRATAGDARDVAEMLDAFNAEFDTETPGAAVLADRLVSLLDGPSTFAVVGGEPTAGVALVTLRPNVWSDGPVALLDEMYVSPARRGGGIGSAIL